MSHLSCKVPFTVDFDSALFVLTKQTVEKETLMISFQDLIDLINKKTCNDCRLLRGRKSMGQKPAELTEEVKRQNDFVWFFQTLDSP